MPFELLRSETLLKGRAFAIRRDWMKAPDGRETNFDIIEHVGSVIIVPLDSDGNLLFVRQFRPATGQDLLELPAGTLEEGEDPGVCAARELREETGMEAGKLHRIGSFYLAPGHSTEFMVVYIAEDLSHNPLAADPDEFITVEKIPILRAFKLAEQCEMPDAKSMAALFLAKQILTNGQSDGLPI